MYVMFADMYMILQKVIRTTEYSPARHLKIFLKIGYVPFVVWELISFRWKNKSRRWFERINAFFLY